MIESNRRVPLTEVRTDRLKIGEYTFILNDVVKEGDKVKEYKTELIGDGGTCLVYRSFMSNGDVKKKVILKEFYPLFNDVNYIPEIDRNIETGELLISEMHKQDDIFQKKLKRFEDSYYTFNELHNDETMNNNSINVMDIVRANNTIYLIIDYNNFMDLFEYMKEEISFYDFLHILQKTASAVGKLHKMDGGGYLHTDITPCNIAVVKEDKYVRLIDSDAMVKRADIEYLNQQREECDEYEIIFSNSQGYSGPEMYMGVKSKIECLYECGPATDVFAIGAILYYYLYGQKISFTNNNGLVREKVINELQKYAYKKELAEKVKEKYAYSSLHTIDLIDKFMEKCLASNIYDRYQGMDEVVEALMKIKKLVEPQTVYIKENFHKNPNKVFGRDGKLKELSEKLQVDGTEGKENKNHLVCISAIGGMGKSTLAKLYAEENMDKYENIVEVWAENARRALININIINYPESDKIRFDALKDENSFAQWKNIVSERMFERKTLLIVHDYYMGEKGDFEIWHELPCDIILTSRDMYSDTSKTVNLSFGDLVSNDENAAIDMFKMYYYQNVVSKGKKIEIERLEKQVNDEEIRKLTEMLNYHPFAIKVIAKQMAKGKYTSEKMLEELKAEGLKAHNGAKFINDGVIDERDHDYGKIDAYGHIRQIFNITARAEMMSDEEKEILRYMILVPSVDGISVGRLIEWCELDEWETEGFIEELEEKGWLEKVEGGVDYLYQGDENKATVYRMPMVITEALKEQEGVMPTVDNTFEYINNCMKASRDNSFNKYEREALYNVSEEIGRYLNEERNNRYSAIITNLGKIIADSRYNKAFIFFEKALEVKEKICNEEDKNKVELYNLLGAMSIQLGEYKKAYDYLEKVYIHVDDIDDIDDMEKMIMYSNLGTVNFKMKKYANAMECYERCLAINNISGFDMQKIDDNEKERMIVKIYCNIYAAYIGMKKYEKGFRIKELLALLEIRPDVFYREIVLCYGNLGNAYCDIGENQLAQESYEKAIETSERTLGVKHIGTAICYGQIGTFFNDICEYKKGIGYYEKAIEILENQLGRKNLKTLEYVLVYGQANMNVQDYLKAIECYERILECEDEMIFQNNELLLDGYIGATKGYCLSGKYLKGLEVYQKTVLFLKRVCEDDKMMEVIEKKKNEIDELHNFFQILADAVKREIT